MLALVGIVALGNALAWPSVLTGAVALAVFALAFLPLWLAERRGALTGALRLVPAPESPRDT